MIFGNVSDYKLGGGLRGDLELGAIYHWLGYEDDELSRPMITSVEYLGLDVLETEPKPDGHRHFFRVVGSEQLQEFQAGKHKLPPEKR